MYCRFSNYSLITHLHAFRVNGDEQRWYFPYYAAIFINRPLWNGCDSQSASGVIVWTSMNPIYVWNSENLPWKWTEYNGQTFLTFDFWVCKCKSVNCEYFGESLGYFHRIDAISWIFLLHNCTTRFVLVEQCKNDIIILYRY